MHPSEASRIYDMLETLRLLQHYVAGRERSDLDSDIQFQDSVVHRIEILGEAAKHVSGQYARTHPSFHGGHAAACATVSSTDIGT